MLRRLIDVDIVLTTAVTELAGRLTSASGASATDCSVVVFPAEPNSWAFALAADSFRASGH